MEKQELCPYCESKIEYCIPHVVYRHAESFGGSTVRFPCSVCGNTIKASTMVNIEVKGFRKTSEDPDWPEELF